MPTIHIMRCAARLIILSLLFIQSCYGTSIVYVTSATGNYVVLAADSRQFHDPRFGNEKSNDKACKVISLGDDTLFFDTGTARIGVNRGNPWNALQVAREIYKTNKDHNAQALSIAWGNRAMAWFSRLSASQLQVVTDSYGGVVTGGFINFDANGEPAVFSQKLSFDVAASNLSRKPETQSKKGQIGIEGIESDLVVEFHAAKTPRALKAYGTLNPHPVTKDVSYHIEFTRKAVQFVIDNASSENREHVHGPIDVVVIRRMGGISWVNRKPNCGCQDEPPTKCNKKPSAKGRQGKN